jgi:hypothetical protein
MKMYFRKIIIALSVIVVLPIVITSCKRYLEIAPQGELSEDEIRTNPNAAADLVTGVYNSLWMGESFGGPDIHGLSYAFLTSVASDDADKGSHPGDYGAAIEIDNFNISTNNQILNAIWRGYYQAVARANQAIKYIPQSPSDEVTKNRLLGETRFIRAYLYFNLVRFFGGVPKIDRVPNTDEANNDEFQTRATKEAIYQFIIEDLQFAVANVPVKGSTPIGKVTKAAAQGLLAKVFLYQKSYQQAYDLSNAIVSGQSGNYGLMLSYDSIWREAGANSIESIFEVQTGTNAQCNTAINQYVISQGPRQKKGWPTGDLGFGFNTPSLDLANAYEPNDRRRAATIIFITSAPGGTVLWDGYRIPSKNTAVADLDSVENERYNYKIYHSRTRETNCGTADRLPKNHRILRLGDVLLIHAEAANELGKMGEAETSLNKLRVRAGLLPITGLSQARMRDTIWHERRVEMAMENDRFFDIVRQGRAGQIMRAHGKAFMDGRNEVFPIPQQQIDLSQGKLKQNPNYQ